MKKTSYILALLWVGNALLTQQLNPFITVTAQAQNLLWVKQLGNEFTIGNDIAVDLAGNCYVTGEFMGSATFGLGEANQTVLSSAGARDIYVAKYSRSGALLWAKAAGGTGITPGGIGNDGGTSIAMDSEGNCYVTGYYFRTAIFGKGEANETKLEQMTDEMSSEIFVAKYDSTGKLIWAKAAGGPGGDMSQAIAVDAEGNCYIAGYFRDYATFGSTPIISWIFEKPVTALTQCFIAKYNRDGNLVWVKQFGDRHYEWCNGIAVDKLNNVYVTGKFYLTVTFGLGEINQTTLNPNLGEDFFLAKYDASGMFLWAESIRHDDVPESHPTEGFDVAVDTVGNSYVVGHLWGTGTFGGGGSNPITLANTDENTTRFIVKYRPNGTPVWAKGVSGRWDGGIAVDFVGNSYETGDYYADSNAIISDILVAEHDSNGVAMWGRTDGGPDYDRGVDIAADEWGNCYVIGQFKNVATFGLGEPNQTTLSATNGEVFVAKYGGMGSQVCVTPPGDRNTLLFLQFENTLNGFYFEKPSAASGITFSSQLEGFTGTAANFPANNQLFYASDNNINSTVGTLEFWIKPNWSGDDYQDHYALTFGESGGMVFGKDAGNFWRFIANRYGENGNPELEVSLYAVPTFQPNEWHHAAFTWDNTSLKLYLDGQLRGETPVTFALPTIPNSTFQVGAEGTAKYLDATLDNVQITKVVQNEKAILAIIKGELGCVPPPKRLHIVAETPFGIIETYSRSPQSLAANTDIGIVHVPLALATWQSSNPSVAAVDSTGKVTGISGGTATITAAFRNVTTTLDVIVIPRHATANGSTLIDFAEPKIFPVVQSPTQIAVGDWDGDGRLDLGVSSLDLSRVDILKGDGAGNFGATGNYAVSARPFDVIAADLNSDNQLDLITGSDDYSGHNASVLLGNGTGGFNAAAFFPLSGDGVYKIVARDLNRDNKLDLVSANQYSDNVSLILGDGTGNFGAATTFPLAPGVGPQGLGIGDFNADTRLDLITANRNQSTVSLLPGDGNGHFAAPSSFPVGLNPRSLLVGDLNRDNQLDVVTVNYTSDDVTVLLGNGTAGFGSIQNYALSAEPGTAALLGDIGDLNGDNKLDLAIGAGNHLAIMIGNGLGGFAFNVRYTFGPNDFVRTAKIADFNGDTHLDLVATVMDWNDAAKSRVAVFLNNTSGTSHIVASSGTVPFAGAKLNALFTEKSGIDEFYVAFIGSIPEGDGLPDTARLVGNGYWLIRKSGEGTFTADLTFTFPAGAISAADVANPSNFKLYRRDDTSTGPWTFLTAATSATATSVTFSGISSLSQFAIGTSSKMMLLAQDKITLDHYDSVEGAIHANGDILFENGNPGTLTGDVSAVGNVTIKRKNHITGNVTVGGKVFVDSKAQVDGVINEHAAVSAIPLPQLSFICDGVAGNVFVKKDKEKFLAPGSYGACYLDKDARLKLAHNGTTGEYFFVSLKIEGEAVLNIDVTGGAVIINVCEFMQFVKDVAIEIVGGDSRALVFNYLGTNNIELGNDGVYQGTFIAPYALVEIGSEAHFQGAVAAKSIMVEKDANLQYHHYAMLRTAVAMPKAAELVPTKYALEQNYPNPFNPTTKIRYALPMTSEVKLLIFNTAGQLVRRLYVGPMPAGYHQFVWDAKNERGEKVASGVYVYVLRAGEFIAKRKLVLLK